MSYTVIKRDHNGQEALRYTGEVVHLDGESVCVRAIFAFSTRDLGYVTLKTGDTFIEWFYTNRWYNVFLIYDVDDGHFKGCYCNLTRPAEIQPDVVEADDLALDVWVAPDGTTTLLDEDEYVALTLDDFTKAQVQLAVRDIQERVRKQEEPFEMLG
jgi:uncharacterized protein